MIRLNFFIFFLSQKIFCLVTRSSFVALSLISCLTSQISLSQNTTVSPADKPKIAPPSAVEKKDTRKVLVIPFEPKLYMSEIDQNVNKETKMNFNQIRYAFRSGLDYSVVAEFKKKYSVVSLLSDTAKSMNDQYYIYSSIAYKYDVVPDSTGKKQADNTINKPKIQNGQITVATNDQRKFMNTKITNPNLLATLHKKYGTEIFIFINQLDMKINVDNSGNNTTGGFDRTAAVHYSIFDLGGNLLNSGLATKNFPANANNPNRIVKGYFSGIAETILANYLAATTPKVDKGKGVLEWQEGK